MTDSKPPANWVRHLTDEEKDRIRWLDAMRAWNIEHKTKIMRRAIKRMRRKEGKDK